MTPTDPSTAKAPGWYTDPRDDTLIRYWDGERWTDKRRRRPSWAGGATGTAHTARRRRRLFLAIAGGGFLLAALLSLAIIQAGKDDFPARTLSRSYTEAANGLCKREMPDLRAARPQPGDKKDPGTRAEVAAKVDGAADQLAKVVTDLRALPVAPADESEVNRWLADWDEFVDVGHRYADAVREGDPAVYTKISKAGNAPSKRVYRFSMGNGMPECTFI